MSYGSPHGSVRPGNDQQQMAILPEDMTGSGLGEMEAARNDVTGSCPICGRSYSEGGDWIQCDGCASWFHQQCVGQDVTIGRSIEWICELCEAHQRPARRGNMDDSGSINEHYQNSLDLAEMRDRINRMEIEIQGNDGNLTQHAVRHDLSEQFRLLRLDLNKLDAVGDSWRESSMIRRRSEGIQHPIRLNSRNDVPIQTSKYTGAIPKQKQSAWDKKPVEKGNCPVFRHVESMKNKEEISIMEKSFMLKGNRHKFTNLEKEPTKRLWQKNKQESLEESFVKKANQSKIRPRDEDEEFADDTLEESILDVKHPAPFTHKFMQESLLEESFIRKAGRSKFREREESEERWRRGIHKTSSRISIEQPRQTQQPARSEGQQQQTFMDPNIFGQDLAELVLMMKRKQIDPLPIFSGGSKAWPGFLKQFEETTEEGKFKPHENLRRLNNCLKGDAHDLVQGKLNDPNLVEDIMYDLWREWGRSDVNVKTIVKDLCDLPPPHPNDRKAIKSYRKELSNGLATLKSFKATRYLNSQLIPDMIVATLNIEFQKKWAIHSRRRLKLDIGEATLEDFVEWFEDETEWVDWITYDVDNSKARKQPQQPKGRSRMNHHEEVHDKNPKGEKASCHFCKEPDHIIADCPEFEKEDLKKRWECAKLKHLCFVCLGRVHKKECPAKKECGVNGCQKLHHPLLHSEPKQEERNLSAFTRGLASECVTHFRIIPIRIFANGKTIETNGFFDEGSAPTLMSMELAEKLGVKGKKDPLCLAWTDDTVRREEESERVEISVAGMNNDKKFVLSNVRTIAAKHLDLPVPSLNVSAAKEAFSYLRDLQIPQPFNRKPELLIGLEHARLGIAKASREGLWNQPVATNTPLGWVVHGKQSSKDPVSSPGHCCVVCECSADPDLNKMVEGYFATENFGVRCVENIREGKEIEQARQILKETTKNVGGRYSTGLLWKTDNVRLPNSKPMAIRRLGCLEKQMSRNPTLKMAICDKIKENVEKGYARKLSPEEAAKHGPTTWYLPIFAVTNPHKPDKIRVVYDAAAKVQGTSLNDNLLTGPDLLKSIIGVLWRAREGKVAVAGDIKDMYHRVLVREEDQDSQRFLWREGDSSRAPDTYVMKVMTFGATCSPCSAQYVKNNHAWAYNNQYPRAVETIINRHYVDDMLDSFNSEEEAIDVTQQVIEIHAKAGFEIRNWISNSKVVLKSLMGTGPAVQEMSLNFDKESTEKILGMYWRIHDDSYVFKLNLVRVDPAIINQDRIPTKREVLKTVMSIFDPHGYVAPVLVHAKILLQDIWRKEIEWDQPLTADLAMKWTTWVDQLKTIENLSIPRCYSLNIPNATDIQLHTFVDASEWAFAAVSFLRIESVADVEVVFVGSKNKVAPKKYLSIPRLELQAAVLGTRLADTIRNEHSVKINERHFWTDSQTVLSWIFSDHRLYKQFVANRISEILDSTRMSEWSWVPSRLNVADLATKSQKELDLSQQGPWFKGPSFLTLPKSEWPESKIKQTNCAEERKLRVNVTKETRKFDFPDVKNFAEWSRLVRCVAWLVRMGNILKGRRNVKDEFELTASELSCAEIYLLKKIQWESFSDEIISLEKGETLEPKSELMKLSPILDPNDGLLKVKGRLDAARNIPEGMKRPVILSRQHSITKMLVMAFHRRFHHINAETVVNEIRQKFWIPGLRAAVKSCIKDCQECKIRKAKPEVPEMSPLPTDRLAIGEDPFTYTGMDYFGPMNVTVGRHHEKRYGVLFTCLTTRAVHIELATSLTTNSCILAIRNFVNRRGPPKRIRSDNGTNLRGADNELQQAVKEINKNQIQAECQQLLPGFQPIEWIWNTPIAPHMGGVWERLVRSIKSVLYICLKEKAPKEEVLRSFLIEAEGVVNSRPLTYLPVDPDTHEAITPNHALRMSGKVVYPQGQFDEDQFETKPWRISQQLAQHFWRRFVREYLPEITTRTKWFKDGKVVKKGDLVIIVDESAARNCWERGRVVEVYPGVDGKIRTATVKTLTSIRKRPVSKLAVLSVEAPEEKQIL